MTERKASRRSFLNYAVTVIVVGVVAGVGGYYGGLLSVPPAAPTTITSTRTVETTKTATTTVGAGEVITTTVTQPVTSTVTAPPKTTTVTSTAPGPTTTTTTTTEIQVGKEEELQKHTEDLIKAAKEEGEVMVYNYQKLSVTEGIVKAFGEAYPWIDAKYFYQAPPGALYTKFVNEFEGDINVCDVICQGSVSPRMKAAGQSQPYISPYREVLPKGYGGAAGIGDPEGYWTFWIMTSEGVSYNTNIFTPETAPKGYTDLVKPQYKDKISFGHFDVGGPHQVGIYWCIWDNPYLGVDWLESVAANNPMLDRKSVSALVELEVAGEIPIVAWTPLEFIWDFQNKGAPVDHAKTQLWAAPHGMNINKKAPHPNAAKLFVDWIMSEEGQKAVNDSAGEPVSPTAPHPKPEIAEVARRSVYSIDKYLERFEETGQIWHRIFD